MLIINQIQRSWMCRNYTSSIFTTSLLCENEPQFKIILGIMLYENKEYHRCIEILKDVETTTSKYYQGFCYKKTKEYTKSLKSFMCIADKLVPEDEKFGMEWDMYLINYTDLNNVYEAIGRIQTLAGIRDDAIEWFKKAFNIFPSYISFINLFEEGISDQTLDPYKIVAKLNEETQRNGKDKENKGSSLDRMRAYIIDFIIEFREDLNHFYTSVNLLILEKYWRNFDSRGIYFLSVAAKILLERGMPEESSKIFQKIRENTTSFIYNLDVYSTALWHSKCPGILAALSKELIIKYKYNNITYMVLSNYFSSQDDHYRSEMCLKRSLMLKRSYYAFALLGHEYMLKNQYAESHKQFLLSLRMRQKNYSALFGLGIAHSKLEKYESAKHFFEKGIAVSPYNFSLKYYYNQFLNNIGDHERIKKCIKKYYNIKTNLLENLKFKLSSSTETEEIMLLELVDVFLNDREPEKGVEVLKMVKTRCPNYYVKKSMIEDFMRCRIDKYLN